MAATIDSLICTTPGTRGGQPCIAGTRLAVSDVAILYTRLGLSAEEIAGKHGVEPASVHAALSYYYAHRDEMEGRIAEEEAFAAHVRGTSASPLADKMRALLGE